MSDAPTSTRSWPKAPNRIPLIALGLALLAGGAWGLVFISGRLVKMDAEALILLCPALVALSGLYAIWFGVVYAVKFEGDRIRVRYPIRSDVVPYSAVASWRREKHIGYSWRRTTLWYFEFQVFDRAGTVLTRFHVSLAEGAEIARQIAAKTGIAEYQDS